jgi:hypothetical protein
MMLFVEALKEMKEGKMVTTEELISKNEYCVLMPGMKYIWKIIGNPEQPNAGSWIPTVNDMLNENWKVLDRKELDNKVEGDNK